MKTFLSIFFSCMLICGSPASSFADEYDLRCEFGSYSSRDAQIVRLVFQDVIVVFSKLQGLASISTLDHFTCSQRVILNEEYQDLLDLLDQFGQQAGSQYGTVTPRTKTFLRTLITRNSLQVGGDILGVEPTDPICNQIAQGHASTQLGVIARAYVNLTNCAVKGRNRGSLGSQGSIPMGALGHSSSVYPSIDNR